MFVKYDSRLYLFGFIFIDHQSGFRQNYLHGKIIRMTIVKTVLLIPKESYLRRYLIDRKDFWSIFWTFGN